MFSNPFLIERIILSNHRQFAHCDIDLTHPDTGVPLKECCFIGVNGSGKSALLKALYVTVASTDRNPDLCSGAIVLTKVRTARGSFYQLHSNSSENDDGVIWYNETLEDDKAWERLATSPLSANEFVEVFQDHRCYSEDDSETVSPGTEDAFTAFFSPFDTLINGQPAEDYTDFLARLVREREAEFFSFLKQSENRSKTVEEAEVDFLGLFPNILDALKDIWSKIIEPSAISFQSEGGGRFVSNQTGSEIGFSDLSRGTQHLLHRTGLVCSRYFQQLDQGGFLFLDEPETGLHPELQVNHINLFRSIIGKHQTQLFVATHSPLIAAQFPDSSRIVLSFDRNGAIQVSRGSAPEGCDANQILMKDFGLKTFRPQKHQAQSGSYSKLRRAIRNADEQEDELADLIDQAVTIRRI